MRVGVDTGGTFTDLVAEDGRVVKVSSTPDAPARAVHDAVRAVECRPRLLAHGTTVATNAILQYQGAVTGMVTTEGFRDVIHIGRHQRPQNYSIQQDIPWQARPLVLREYRRPVPERLVSPDGSVLTPLDRDAVRAAAEFFRDERVESVAVCFLFSYLNGAHEREAAAIVREVMPDAYVCTSSEVVPQFREFERFTTTSINAFVGPSMKAYLGQLESEMRDIGVRAPLHIMQSTGGGLPVSAAPALGTIASVPAGGRTGS